MRERYELRVYESEASRLLSKHEGKRLGSIVRLINIPADGEMAEKIGRLQLQMRRKGEGGFFAGWRIYRWYSNKEIEAAKLFQLDIGRTFEPAGEMCGTEYDEASACPICGSGAKQLTPLFLPRKRIPSSQDISRSIAGEIVVSRRVKDLFARDGITGARFAPIRSSGRVPADLDDWFQLIVDGDFADVSPRTRFGINPFDDSKECEGEIYLCPRGDSLGLNLLSEVSIVGATRGEADIFATKQFVGVRRGVLRPERMILVSKKLQKLITSEKLKGFKFEVAYLD